MRRALVMIAWAVAACGHAPAYEARGEPEGRLADVRLREGLLVTTAEVDGAAVGLVLDLASVHPLTLTRDDLETVGARPTGEVVHYRDATGAALEGRVYEIGALRWAGVTWRRVRAVEARWSDGFAPPVRAGVLGLPLVRGLRVTLAVPDGVVTLSPSAPCPPGSVPLEVGQGMFAEGELDGEAVEVLIDTAATADIATSAARGGRHRLRVDPVDLGSLVLAPLDLPEVPAEVILGTPTLAAYRSVVFDLGARCVFFVEPDAGELERTLTRESMKQRGQTTPFHTFSSGIRKRCEAVGAAPLVHALDQGSTQRELTQTKPPSQAPSTQGARRQ